MHIKIYFNDKPLFLTDNIDDEIEPYVHHDDTIFIDEFSTPGVNSMIHEMRQDKVHAGIYYHPDLENLQKAFRKKFTLIRAAGGMVLNEDQQVLMIFRRGKWDLPKGKLDPGETPELCAVRETKEETLLQTVELETFLLTTCHTYEESGHHILKETYWYRMHAANGQELKPQIEEDITRAEWAGPAEIREHLQNTYPLIKDVLEKGGYA